MLQPNDIVTNGGPPMTVETVDGDHVQCAWFEGCEQRRQVFPAATLTPAAAVITAPAAKVKVRWKVAHHGFAAGIGDVMEIPANIVQRHVAAGNVEILDEPRGQGASPGLREGLIGPSDGDTPKATPHETDESRPAETPGHVPAGHGDA